MTKDKLKDGDRLTLRNGEVGYFIKEHGIVIIGGVTYSYEHYLDGLIDRWNGEQYDIVKVERIRFDRKRAEEDYRVDIAYIGESDLNDYVSYQTIWEREEQPKKIEPTYEELLEEVEYLQEKLKKTNKSTFQTFSKIIQIQEYCEKHQVIGMISNDIVSKKILSIINKEVE